MQDNPIVIAALGLYLFVFTCFLNELLAVFVGVKLHVSAAAGLITLGAGLLHGGLGRFLKTPFLWCWSLLYLWYLLASLFGMYPRAGLLFMGEYGLRFHVLPIFFCAMCTTTRGVRALIHMAGAGFAVILLVSLKYGQMMEGRFILPSTSLANPNDLAFHLVLGFCFLVLSAWTPGILPKLYWACLMPPTVVLLLKTGSRSNVITMVAVAFVLFLGVSWLTRIVLLGLALVGFPLLLAKIPEETLHRLKAIPIVSDPSELPETKMIEEAWGSTEARKELQRRAVQLSLAHPFFGVGPGMFPNAVDERVRREEGRKSTWQTQHNAYLQVSSEAGLPALVFYLWSLLLCLKLNYTSWKASRSAGGLKRPAAQSFCLLLISVAYAVGTFFCNIAYFYYFSFIVGFTSANWLAVKRELEAAHREERMQPVKV